MRSGVWLGRAINKTTLSARIARLRQAGALIVCAFASLPGCSSAHAGTPEVHIIQAPAGCLVPDVAVDSSGNVHMVYGLDNQAWHMKSADDGRTFNPPVKVNSSGVVETKMGERGPKLALGESGSVHVAWMDQWAPGVKTYARYARSLNGGGTFEEPKSVSEMSGIDGVTVTADERGNVLLFWHVMAEPKPEVKSATWLYMACSTNAGANFAANQRVSIKNLSGLACSMCMMRARVGTNGSVYLAFRSAQESIRDFYILEGKVGDNDFNALRVNEDNWKIDYCPMCGPELAVAPNGSLLCAFMSRNRVFWAAPETSASPYRLHVSTPTDETDEIYPTAVANRKGEVLLLWQVGPMATKGTASVKWACYDREGRPLGEPANLGRSLAGTKATAFVDKNDLFHIVTTAQKAP